MQLRETIVRSDAQSMNCKISHFRRFRPITALIIINIVKRQSSTFNDCMVGKFDFQPGDLRGNRTGCVRYHETTFQAAHMMTYPITTRKLSINSPIHSKTGHDDFSHFLINFHLGTEFWGILNEIRERKSPRRAMGRGSSIILKTFT